MFIGQTWIKSFVVYLTYEKNYSQNTISAYQTDIADFFRFIDYDTDKLQKISPIIISEWLATLSSKKLSPRSISRKISSLRSLYSFLLRKKEVSTNPFKLFNPPKATKIVPTTLTFSEVESVWKNLPTDTILQRRNKYILIMLYSTGLRAEELCTIKCSDVSHDFLWLRVMGKGKKERRIPLVNVLQDMIKMWMSERNELDKGVSQAIFLSKNGRQLTTAMIRNIVGQVSVYVSKQFSPHGFRYTFASHLLDSNANLRHIQELLGHSSLSVTQRYTKISIVSLKGKYHQFHPRG